MGLTNLKLTVANPKDESRHSTIEFLVDSGAIYSVLDEQILKKLGVEPRSEEEFILADGTVIKRKKGGLVYKYKDEISYAPVIFGKKGDTNLLGATTLESLGFSLDPFRRQLFKLPMILGGLRNQGV